jgi:hypothetical protein
VPGQGRDDAGPGTPALPKRQVQCSQSIADSGVLTLFEVLGTTPDTESDSESACHRGSSPDMRPGGVCDRALALGPSPAPARDSDSPDVHRGRVLRC